MTKFSVDREMRRAKAAEREGALQEAQRIYQAILEKFPNNARARQALSELRAPAVTVKLPGEATPQIADAEQSLVSRGVASREQGRLQEAIQSFRLALTCDPESFSALRELGIALKLHGNADEAIACFQRAAKVDPEALDAQMFAGLLLKDEGRFDEAVEAFGNAVRIQPRSFEAQYGLAIGLMYQRKYDDAASCLRQALKLRPDSAQAHVSLGSALRHRLRDAEAIEHFRRALRIDPNSDLAHVGLGNVLIHQNRLDEAVGHFEQALRINPDSEEAHVGYGNLLAQRDRLEDAVQHFERALQINLASDEAHVGYASVCVRLRQTGEAIRHLERALQINPDSSAAHIAYGNVLIDEDKFEDAIRHFDQALRINPDSAGAHAGYGAALSYQDRFEDAVSRFEQALRIDPDLAAAHVGIGFVFAEQGKLDEARAAYDRALASRPDDVMANVNLSQLTLLRGDFEKGWTLHEWRKKLRARHGAREFPVPVWSGAEDLAGKSVFLHWEQGHGDTIQFVRYVELVKALGAKVTLSVQDLVLPLISGQFADIEVLGAEAVPERFDYHAPLMSLPLAFGTHAETVPAATPYLRADPERARKWAGRIGSEGFKIGICWQGGTSKIDRGRSFPVAEMQGIARLPGVRLISLHKGAGESQLDSLPDEMTVETLGEDFDPPGAAFLDTAAVIEQCDLVISSDTAVAHLAGALGAPVWLVLKHVPDWRWLLGRDSSPWYPTMRLFRQERRGDWASAFAEVERALATLVEMPRQGARPDAGDAQPATMPLIPASWGEVIDKITILEIKSARIGGDDALANVRRELELLRGVVSANLAMTEDLRRLEVRLSDVNGELWDIEDAIREKERGGSFDAAFVSLARSVYKANDIRSALKREINLLTASAIVEEKSYR